MDTFIGFIEVAGAIIGAIGLAMSLEWFALNGLMRLMPPRHECEGVVLVQVKQAHKTTAHTTGMRLFPH